MIELSLSKQEWLLRGYWPWIPVKDRSMETGIEMVGVTDWIPATVPGGVHYDLFRSGWIQHPYNDLQSLHCEWVENRWWVYKTSFPRPQVSGTKFELVLQGLDYETMVYCNNTLLGEHTGMYHPAEYDVTNLVRENASIELKLVFKGVPQEMGQIGYTSRTSTQKSRFNYKWDFSTRLVNIGPWQDIVLRVHETCSLDDLAIHTDTSDQGEVGHVRIKAKVKLHVPEITPAGLKLQLRLEDPEGGLAAVTETEIGEELRTESLLDIRQPKLWNVHGFGEQPLYRLHVRLAGADGYIFDERTHNVGIRKLEYKHNEGAPDDSFPYTFVVNGTPVFIKGVNITPLDHLYGNVSGEQYEWLVYRMKRANVNLVRVWGGGLIEKRTLYDLCDRHGILVWQEFIQSSSGIDNVPSKLTGFLDLLGKSAAAALKEKRNHVSLAVWSGGNELMSAPDTPSTLEDENLAILHKLVLMHDPERLFLPTSASGPREFISRDKGVSHDVHGGWQYQGNPGHYELYGESDHLFHSEFGVDGVTSVRSLRKFFSPEHHYPTRMREHVIWRHHGEWWGTLDRDQTIFGPIHDISDFSDCSQWMQAEGLRYIIEANRRRAFRSSGCVVWQMNEPWPNASCTNLVDYYGDAKMAYHWMQEAYAPRRATLDYRRIDHAVGSDFAASVWVHNDASSTDARVRVRVYNRCGTLMQEELFHTWAESGRPTSVGELRFNVTPDHEGLFFVRLEWEDAEPSAPSAMYTFGTESDHVYASARSYHNVQLSIEPQTDWQTAATGFDLPFIERSYLISNTGMVPALHIRAAETTNAYWSEVEEQYFTLLPGEARLVKARCTRKAGGGFLSADQYGQQADVPPPSLEFTYFCAKTATSAAL
ncbi:glycoside hydrolase family 2 protein [Paenibacillus gansuensis]|uniref:beta-mannosidase n=1 Tax=Paenibacillus gansuensis TaxID=306542 RepID=A0ABW5PBL4_9BACL